MKAQHVPQVNWRYWAAITLASISGTNLGDLYAHDNGLGIVAAVSLLAVLAAIAFLGEFLDRRGHQVWYWTVILIIRTGATNVADFLAYEVGIPMRLLDAGLIVMLACFAMVSAMTARSRPARAKVGNLPDTGLVYWLAMLTAGVLGTVLGDDFSHVLGGKAASLLLGSALLMVLVALPIMARSIIGYWAIVGLARTAGTAIGDWLAASPRFNLGLPVATALTTTTFVAILLLWPAAAVTDPERKSRIA